MNTDEFDESRISMTSTTTIEQLRRSLSKVLNSYDRVITQEKTVEIENQVKKAESTDNKSSLLCESGNIPAILKGTGAFMFPLVDILEEEPKDLVVAKQYTKVLEAKFLQVSKELQNLQMKIWQEKEYKNEFDTMMAKMTTIVKESNYSIVQYLNKTKERMQDVEAELHVEDKQFWARVSDQDNAIRRLRGLHQELTVKSQDLCKQLNDANQKISDDLRKREEVLENLREVLGSLEEHYEESDMNEVLIKIENETQELESVTKEIKTLSASVTKFEKDIMILEDLKGFLKQEEQKFFSYRSRLEMYNEKGEEVDTSSITQNTKEELGNFALERKIESLSDEIQQLNAIKEEQEKKIEEQAAIIQDYEDKYTGNKLEVRLRDIEKKYDVAQSEIEKFKTQEKLYRGKIRKLLINRGIEYIEDMYDAMAEDRKKLIEYEKKIQILENSVEEHKTISQNLQEEQREIEEILKQRNMTIMEELNKQKSLVESLKGQLSDKDQLINNREANNKNLLEDMEHLKVELDALNQKYSNAINENELLLSNKEKEFNLAKVEYENQIQGLQSTIDQNQVLLSQLTNERDELNVQLTSIQEQLSGKNGEISLLNENTKQSSDGYESRITTMADQFSALQAEYKQYKEEMEAKYQQSVNEKGVDQKEVEVYKKQIANLETSLSDEKEKYEKMFGVYEEEKKKYEETLAKNAEIISELKKKTVTTESENEKMSIEDYQKRVQELIQLNDTLQSKLNQKDAIYKDQLNQQIAFYESLKQDYVKNNNLSSETGAINHDKCIERETDLTNENIVLKNELEQMKLKEIDYKRQISECELRYRNLFSKYDVLLKKEQEEVPIDVHELQHSLREKNYQIEILTKKIKLLEDAIDPRGVARNEQNIRIFLNMNINLPLAIQDFVHKYIRFDVFALDMIEREGGADGLLHALIYSILDVTAQANIMKKLFNLIKNQDTELQRMIQKGILSYIHNSMSMHTKDIPLQRYSMIFIATLCRLFDKNTEVFEKENICDAVVQCFLNNKGDKIIQKYCFTSLSLLLKSAMNLKKVLHQNIVGYIINILSGKMVDPIVIEQGLSTLVLLCDSPKVVSAMAESTLFDCLRLILANNIYNVENNTVAYNTVINSLFILQKCSMDHNCIVSILNSGLFVVLIKYLRSNALYMDIVNQIFILIKFICAFNDCVPALLEYGLLDVCNISTPLYLQDQEISLNLLAIYIKLAEVDPTNELWFDDGINGMKNIENEYMSIYGVQEATDSAINSLYQQNNIEY